MPFFMMSNRVQSGSQLGDDLAKSMAYFMAPDNAADLSQFATWQALDEKSFHDRLIAAAEAFPRFSDEENEKQKHVSLFVHGYNVSWQDAATRYADLNRRLYGGQNGLGILVLYTWPSNGSVAAYLPDREDARDSAPALADALVTLHDRIVHMQRVAARDPAFQCKAKISVIAHSMGNYVMQKALAIAAKKLNSPQLITLIHQLVMVAADVDNDLFQKDQPDASDGYLMSNLCYRIGALYTGLDSVLGASAGLKHFGTRRLGRSGLADAHNVRDNVFDFDITNHIEHNNIHSAAFESSRSIELIRKILVGVDRKFLTS